MKQCHQKKKREHISYSQKPTKKTSFIPEALTTYINKSQCPPPSFFLFRIRIPFSFSYLSPTPSSPLLPPFILLPLSPPLFTLPPLLPLISSFHPQEYKTSVMKIFQPSPTFFFYLLHPSPLIPHPTYQFISDPQSPAGQGKKLIHTWVIRSGRKILAITVSAL